MDAENDEWREPWDEKTLMFFRGAKVRCEKCGLVMQAKDSHVIPLNDHEGIQMRIMTLCDRCYESLCPTNS